MQVLEGKVPEALLPAALDALAEAVVAGETVHPDQGRLRRTLERVDELWRRSGGRLAGLDRASLHGQLREQLEREGVNGWESFIRSRLALDVCCEDDREERTPKRCVHGRGREGRGDGGLTAGLRQVEFTIEHLLTGGALTAVA